MLNIACNNWREQYPAMPRVSVAIRNDAEYLRLRYKVKGKELLAASNEDHSKVWCDSCVEFFCRLPEQAFYLNFEINCIGAMTAARREGRDKNVEILSLDKMHRILRYAPLAERFTTPFHEAFEQEWEVGMDIPFYLLSGVSEKQWREEGSVLPKTLLCNFYACADNAKEPYYLSWAPIATPAPDFHRPEFFSAYHLW